VDAVGTTQNACGNIAPIIEPGFNAVPPINKSSQPVTGMEPLAWKRGDQHCEYIASMRLIMRVPERINDSVSKRRF
jgi:hypothetical protein